MASVEAGASAVSAPFTSNLSPAGSGLTPVSSVSQYMGPKLSSTGADTGDYGLTILQDAPVNLAAVQGVTHHFKMIGQDRILTGVYDTWIVNGTSDFAGSQYGGLLNTPLRNIAVELSWDT